MPRLFSSPNFDDPVEWLAPTTCSRPSPRVGKSESPKPMQTAEITSIDVVMPSGCLITITVTEMWGGADEC